MATMSGYARIFLNRKMGEEVVGKSYSRDKTFRQGGHSHCRGYENSRGSDTERRHYENGSGFMD
jgi:hypothetical protein